MKRPLLNISTTGGLTATAYVATLLFYLKGPEGHSRTAKQVFAILCVSALLILFWHGYKLLSKEDDTKWLRAVILFGLLFAAVAVFTFPFHSTDVFGYINRGWQQTHYGQNPYSHPLADVPDWQHDPMLREHWIYNPNPYGFLFTLLARALCALGNGNWWVTLFLFKLVNFAAYIATALIVWRGAKLLGRAKPVTTLFLFMWNPLVLLHCLANGHNDILTGLLVVFAFYLAITDRWFLVIPALTAAALLKYAPGLLIPVAFAFVVKKRSWVSASASLFVAVLLIGAISFPYLRDFEPIRFWNIQENATLVDNSLHSFLIHIFDYVAKLIRPLAALHDPVNAAIKWMLRGGFLVFLAWQWLKIPREFNSDTLLRKSLLILFVLFCIVTSKFNGWYMAIMVPLALIVGVDYWLGRLVLLISAAQTLSLTFFKQAYIINYLVMILLPMFLVLRQEKQRVNRSNST